MTDAPLPDRRPLAADAVAWAGLAGRARSGRRWSNAALGLGLALVALIGGACLLLPTLGWDDPEAMDLAAMLRPPSLAHPFGTDDLGRDVLVRVVHAGRTDLLFGLAATYSALAIGVLVGAAAGYAGGWLDALAMRLADLVIAFPFIVLVLAFAAVLGPGLWTAYLGVVAVGWAVYARMTRNEMVALRDREFVVAARAMGFSPLRVVWRHALPNAIRPSLVFSVSDIVLSILTLASLSYLGLGVRPPAPEWGEIIAQGQKSLFSAWWIATMPGLVIVALGLGFGLIGDALADRDDAGGAG